MTADPEDGIGVHFSVRWFGEMFIPRTLEVDFTFGCGDTEDKGWNSRILTCLILLYVRHNLMNKGSSTHNEGIEGLFPLRSEERHVSWRSYVDACCSDIAPSDVLYYIGTVRTGILHSPGDAQQILLLSTVINISHREGVSAQRAFNPVKIERDWTQSPSRRRASLSLSHLMTPSSLPSVELEYVSSVTWELKTKGNDNRTSGPEPTSVIEPPTP